MGFLERIRQGEVLLLDGAAGTYLQGKGLAIGQAPETWNLTHPDVVCQMAVDYFAAGSDLVCTNTFGGNRLRLSHQDMAQQVEEVNRTAVELARSGTPGDGMVVGSIGPTGTFLEPLGTISEKEMTEVFHSQMEALAKAGVDAFCIETMTALDEASLAIKAAASFGLPVLANMTFDAGPKGFATAMGVTVDQAVDGMMAAGADMIGSNCGSGIAQMVEIAGALGRVSDLPVMVQSNAGLPELREGVAVYTETPQQMAGYCKGLVEAGVSMIGGCCGTGPDHISAMENKLIESGCWKKRSPG
jgi:5-methyltetrahydrofolate--homocysteine methyltransferase